MGGMQRHSFFIAKYLAQNKIFVELFHTQHNNNLAISKLECFTDDEKKYINSHVIQFPQMGKAPGHYLRESYEYSIRIFNKLKDIKNVDFIYAKGFSGWKCIQEKIKGHYFGAPIAVKFHGLNMFQKPPGIKGWLESLLFKSPVKYNMLNADYVFSYGGRITEITKRVGVLNEKIIELPTGIESDWIKSSNEIKKTTDDIKFVYVGRYERLKGIEELSLAIKQLDKFLKAEFHFVGPIPERKKIKGSNIFYHGAISDKSKIVSILDSCDVLVCPSYSEGMPNVIIEAMSRGLAIMATDVGAINYLVSSKNGWLIKEPTVLAIKTVLTDIIKFPKNELDLKKVESIYFTEKNLKWENVATGLITALNNAIKSYKTSSGRPDK